MTQEEQITLNESLFEAIRQDKSVEEIKVLIEKGADVNAKGRRGLTPLMYAKTAEQTKLLIDTGADVNAKNKYGLIPLMYAKTAEQEALLEAAMQKATVKRNIEKHKKQILKSRKMRKEIEKRHPEEKISGAVWADKIARDVISGTEKRTITPEVGAEIRRRKAFEK